MQNSRTVPFRSNAQNETVLPERLTTGKVNTNSNKYVCFGRNGRVRRCRFGDGRFGYCRFGGMGRFGDVVSAMDVSAINCL